MNVKKQKLLMILPTLAKGGAERVAAILSNYFPPNIEVIFVLFKREITYNYRGRVISLDLPGQRGILKKVFSMILRYVKLKKILREEQPDKVISFLEGPNFLNIISYKEPIIGVHNYKSISDKKNIINKIIIKYFYPKASLIITCSNEIKEDLVKNWKINSSLIKVIYNPIDIKEIRKLTREDVDVNFREIFKFPVIINVGSLTEQKGQKYLIQAFAEVKKEIKDAKLLILGEGPLRKELELLAEKLGVKEDVIMPGFVKNPFKYIARSKLFVLSSLWEGFPMALLEAIACGVPVISSNCKSGPAEILDNDFLFPPKDINAMSTLILKFLKLDKDYLYDKLEKLQKTLERELNPLSIAKRYLEILGK